MSYGSNRDGATVHCTESRFASCLFIWWINLLINRIITEKLNFGGILYGFNKHFYDRNCLIRCRGTKKDIHYLLASIQ